MKRLSCNLEEALTNCQHGVLSTREVIICLRIIKVANDCTLAKRHCPWNTKPDCQCWVCEFIMVMPDVSVHRKASKISNFIVYNRPRHFAGHCDNGRTFFIECREESLKWSERRSVIWVGKDCVGNKIWKVSHIGFCCPAGMLSIRSNQAFSTAFTCAARTMSDFALSIWFVNTSNAPSKDSVNQTVSIAHLKKTTVLW